MKKHYLFRSIFVLGALTLMVACKKQSPINVYNPQEVLKRELPAIQSYISTHSFPYTVDSVFNTNGIFYQIINPGTAPDTGKYIYKTSTILKVKYTGKVLGNAQSFDQSDSASLSLVNLIRSWQYVIPKIQPKGRVRFISSSVFGYQDMQAGSIPPNSILDFDVEVLNVSENK